MGLLSIAILLLSAAFLAYRHYPGMLKTFLPRGRWPAAVDTLNSAHDDRKVHEREQATRYDDEEEQEGEEEAGEASDASTPKANPRLSESSVPTFTLSGDEEPKEKEREGKEEEEEEEEEEAEVERAIFHPPRLSAQRASVNPPPAPPPSPPRPVSEKPSGLMLPPARPINMSRPNGATSMRVPTTGPLSNRGPPTNSQQRISSTLFPTGAVKPPNAARNKIFLQPGHSPMDWAALTRSGNVTGVSMFQRVTPSHLKTMSGRKGKRVWSSWQGKVYDITPYLPFHPGGEAELMKAAGRDGTKLFMDVHPWVNWENMLGSCLVGVMVPENYGMTAEGSSLEDMD